MALNPHEMYVTIGSIQAARPSQLAELLGIAMMHASDAGFTPRGLGLDEIVDFRPSTKDRVIRTIDEMIEALIAERSAIQALALN